MENGGFWRLVLAIVVAIVAIRIVLWAFFTLVGILKFAITIAVIVGIVWLLIQIFGRKKAYL